MTDHKEMVHMIDVQTLHKYNMDADEKKSIVSAVPVNQIPRPTWVEVDLAAIENNTRQIRQLIGPNRLLMSVVKANAYGHGAIDVSQAALRAGTDRLAVASLSEAIALRNGGIQAPILVLGYTPTYQAQEAIRADITLTVFDADLAQALAKQAQTNGQPIKIHLKVNTGMNRLGLLPETIPSFIEQISAFVQLEIEGIYTHFATADQRDQTFMLEQLTMFKELLHLLSKRGIRPPIAHCANSAATIFCPQSHMQMVRAGIATYGLHPDVDEARLPDGFMPALSWKALVAQVADLQPGDSVSYGREFTAQSPMTIATIPVGYADGFPRKPHNWDYVLIRGQAAPIIGRVCMDQTIVDVTHIQLKNKTTSEQTGKVAAKIKPGEGVVLIGVQEGVTLTADQIGQKLDTINYDVVSRIRSRVPRIYVSS